jgi:hypothetical protein
VDWRARLANASPATRLLVVLALVVLVGGWSTAFLRPETHTMTVSLSLVDTDDSYLDAGDSCTGSGGYDDIGPGTRGVVSDESGTTLQTGTLSDGTYDGYACVFEFVVEDLPKARYYQIELGRETRGTLQYSLAELDRQGWHVELNLGGD